MQHHRCDFVTSYRVSNASGCYLPAICEPCKVLKIARNGIAIWNPIRSSFSFVFYRAKYEKIKFIRLHQKFKPFSSSQKLFNQWNYEYGFQRNFCFAENLAFFRIPFAKGHKNAPISRNFASFLELIMWDVSVCICSFKCKIDLVRCLCLYLYF